jgi:hypothetical protein
LNAIGVPVTFVDDEAFVGFTASQSYLKMRIRAVFAAVY